MHQMEHIIVTVHLVGKEPIAKEKKTFAKMLHVKIEVFVGHSIKVINVYVVVIIIIMVVIVK